MTSQARPILEGLTVVELSAFVAAPLCGATLAALGAEVIRVDPPKGGIDYRRWPLYEGRSLYWAGLNQGKRSVTIDTREQRGREQVAKLVSASGDGAGILVTNLPTSDWNSYEALSKRRRDLIMVQITGQHDGGAAVDYTVNAGLGFPFVTGPEGQVGPVNHVLPAWDAMAGFLAAMALLAAERHRRLTGDGQLVVISLEDVGLAVAGHLGYLAEAQLIDQPRKRYGNYLYGTFGRDFVTRDGQYVMVVALTPRQWKSLIGATNLAGPMGEIEGRFGRDFQLEADRWQSRAEIADLLETWIAERDLGSVATAFNETGVLWSQYRSFKSLLAGQLADRKSDSIVQEVDEPGLGKHIATSSPVRFGASANLPARPAPELGQDTAEVMKKYGLDD